MERRRRLWRTHNRPRSSGMGTPAGAPRPQRTAACFSVVGGFRASRFRSPALGGVRIRHEQRCQPRRGRKVGGQRICRGSSRSCGCQRRGLHHARLFSRRCSAASYWLVFRLEPSQSIVFGHQGLKPRANSQLQRTSARSLVSLVSRSPRRAEAAELGAVRALRHSNEFKIVFTIQRG